MSALVKSKVVKERGGSKRVSLKSSPKTFKEKREQGLIIKTIFFPTDFTEQNVSLLPLVVDLCRKLEAELILFHAFKVAVVDEYMPASMIDDMIVEGERQSLDRLKKLVDSSWEISVSYNVKMGFTAESISEAAVESGADIIIMGTNGCNSLEDRVFGTVSWNTIKHAEIPVLTLPEGVKELKFDQIIFPFECTDKDIDIIHFALKLSAIFKSTIHLIHFLLEGAVLNKTIIDKINAKFHKEIQEERLQIQILADKNITTGIEKYAERIGADTIVMVTHSRGLMATLFHMSTTRKIALYNNIPLFAFKAD